MTTTKSITSTNYIAAGPTKPLSRIERTKSFLKASLIKKWKSSKELFTRPLSNYNSNNDNNIKSASRKQLETQLQNGKFINEKVLENLDEFERNFLLSAGRKILVRELRKNFEKPPSHSSISNSSGANKSVVITVNNNNSNNNNNNNSNNNNNKSRSGAVRMPKASNLPIENVEMPKKKFANASCQTIPSYDDISDYVTNSINAGTTTNYMSNQKPCPLVTRHSSFYNTYRNEYCAWQSHSHYASNLSLISSTYGIPSSSERCLEKTINKYKNSIKSSSAVDLSSIYISSTATAPTSSMGQSMERGSITSLHRPYSSIINISQANSQQNLTDSSIIDYDDYGTPIDATTTPYVVYENVKTINNKNNNINSNSNSNSNNQNHNSNISRNNNIVTQLKQTPSIKSLNTVPSSTSSTAMRDAINNTNVNIRFRNGDDDYDTKSMIVTSGASILYDTLQNRSANACHFNRCNSQTDLHGSNISLTIVHTPAPNDSNYNAYTNTQSCDMNSTQNCHDKYLNNKSIVDTIACRTNQQQQDGNNNNTMIKIRKCYSINQIDLGLLKNELDEYIDRELRTTNFGRNTLAQRRYQFENNLKKVIKFNRFKMFQIKSIFFKAYLMALKEITTATTTKRVANIKLTFLLLRFHDSNHWFGYIRPNIFKQDHNYGMCSYLSFSFSFYSSLFSLDVRMNVCTAH